MTAPGLTDLLERSIAGEKPAPENARRYIGSGDIGPILALYHPEMTSLAKYVNATDCWLRIVHGIKQPPNARMTRGLDYEPIARAQYRATVGPVSEPPGVIQHPKHAWACASPDGFIGNDGIAEYKTTTIYSRESWGEPGTDLVPDGYNAQVQWMFEATDRTWAHCLVAFGADGPKDSPGFTVHETAIYELHKDDELCAEMVKCGRRFWSEFVETKMPPQATPMHNKRDFKRLLAQHNQGRATP